LDILDHLGRGPALDIGVLAPDFTLTMVETDQLVSLADYRGKSPLLLGLYRGIYCAFCRRAVARLSQAGTRLRPFGIATLAVVSTTLANARLYYRYHPPGLAIAVDPALVTHRAYGLPKIEATWEAVSTLPRNTSGELAEALPLWEATKALGRLDGFKPTDTDREDGKRTWNQSAGEFLIDRDGIVRWLYVEGATPTEYMAKFSSHDELLSAASALRP
jgi:peroxiredoxin